MKLLLDDITDIPFTIEVRVQDISIALFSQSSSVKRSVASIGYCRACLVVLGRNKHIRPPLASSTATMNVGAGQ